MYAQQRVIGTQNATSNTSRRGVATLSEGAQTMSFEALRGCATVSAVSHTTADTLPLPLLSLSLLSLSDRRDCRLQQLR